MDYKKELLKRSLDTSNGFIYSESSEAQSVSRSVWDMRLREYEEANLVVTPLAGVYDFRKDGKDYTIFVDEASSAATALVETTDVTISAISTRSVTFTPTEYGAAYQLTRKAAVRAFFNVADNMVKKLGYSLALKKDALAVAACRTGASNSVIANDVVSTAIASTDTLNYAALTKARQLIIDDYYTPEVLVINPIQHKQLLDLGTINKANEFGTRDAIQKGLVGELFGLRVIVGHSISSASSKAKALVLGVSGTGEAAFGYAIKRDPIIEKEYHARGRYWDVVAHEEYNFQVLHPNAICTVETYSA